jgi:agmatine deiminase
MLTLGLVQMSVSEDQAKNLEKALRLVRRAARGGAKIVCLPELFRSRYFPQTRRAKKELYAEAVPGETTRAFSRLARELAVVIVVPLYERSRGGRLYNSAVVVDADGRLLSTYRKLHIPHDPLFYEQDYFAPGDRGFIVYKTRYAAFSVLICFDQWFPEAARACALKGAELLFYPTAIGEVAGQRPREGDWRDSWVTIQRAHAIANSVHVAAVNRTGREGRLRFWGTSFVADAFGKVLKIAPRDKEKVLLCRVDLSSNKPVRDGWGFMRNRRPDRYGILCRTKR